MVNTALNLFHKIETPTIFPNFRTTMGLQLGKPHIFEVVDGA
jgi:hypothetical protein